MLFFQRITSIGDHFQLVPAGTDPAKHALIVARNMQTASTAVTWAADAWTVAQGCHMRDVRKMATVVLHTEEGGASIRSQHVGDAAEIGKNGFVMCRIASQSAIPFL